MLSDIITQFWLKKNQFWIPRWHILIPSLTDIYSGLQDAGHHAKCLRYSKEQENKGFSSTESQISGGKK